MSIQGCKRNNEQWRYHIRTCNIENSTMGIGNQNSTNLNDTLNENSDVEYSMRYIRWLFRFLGIWPLVVTKTTRFEKNLSKFVLLFASISMTTLTAPICAYIIVNPLDRLEIFILLGPIASQLANIVMHVVMILRSKTLKLCVQHMELDWRSVENSDERDIMMKNVRYSHFLTFACICVVYGGAFAYALILPIFSGNTINELNETLRPRPFPGTEIFIDDQANIVYEIVYFLNFISVLIHNTVTTAVCNLTVLLVSHACGQIQIVVWRLHNFVDQSIEQNNDTDAIMELIKIIVKKHVRLLEFTSNIEKTLRELFLAEVVASTLIICFIEYDFIITLERSNSNCLAMLTYAMLFISYAFNLFLYCQFGENLTEQCQGIGNAAYMTEWYKLPGRTKLALTMIINISSYPCKLTAGRMMELSIFNFASIMKTSFAYFNMMRTMA